MADASSPEDILERIGGCGRFQVLLCVTMHLMKTPTMFNMMLTLLAVAKPKWWCGDRMETYNVSMTTTSEIDMVTVGNIDLEIDLDLDSGRLENCKNLNGSACSDFIYDKSMNTIVSEWDLVCDLSWIPSMIASIQMGGLLVGNIVCGQLADSIGRKIPLFLSLVIIIVASLICYFSTGTVMFAAGRVLSGFGMGCYLTVQYSIVSEMTLARVRPWVIALPSWPALACIWSLVAYLVPDWRNMHLVIVLVTVPFLATWWFIPESFRWYLSHDRSDDARRVIQYIAKINAHDVTDDITDTIIKDVSSAETDISDVYRSQLTSAFAMVASLGVGTAWGPVATMTQELYPTVIRNIAFGYLNVFARLGAIIVPQLAFLDTKVAGIMYFLSSFLSVLCVSGSFALSETRERNLNDKIRQKMKEVYVEDKEDIQM